MTVKISTYEDKTSVVELIRLISNFKRSLVSSITTLSGSATWRDVDNIHARAISFVKDATEVFNGVDEAALLQSWEAELGESIVKADLVELKTKTSALVDAIVQNGNGAYTYSATDRVYTALSGNEKTFLTNKVNDILSVIS